MRGTLSGWVLASAAAALAAGCGGGFNTGNGDDDGIPNEIEGQEDTDGELSAPSPQAGSESSTARTPNGTRRPTVASRRCER